MVKVSVIVPVYNVENYLRKCLDSLVYQTLAEIEILVVNDGSTDRSGVIIKEYAEKYDHIRSLDKTNGGLSDARNYALPFTKGEYIGYVDSDDFVEPNMFELLYLKAKAESSDIVECNLRHTYPDSESIEIGQKIQDKKQMIMVGRSVVWNKIYHREWLLSTKVVFPKGIIYEDVEFFVKLVPYIRKYSYIDEAGIHYVQRESSINHMSSVKTLDILKVLENIQSFYKEQGFYEQYKDAIEFLFIRILLCSSFLRMCRIQDRPERNQALQKNFMLLTEQYPNWRNSIYLKQSKGLNGIFMKSVNTTTYQIYSIVLPFAYRFKQLLKRKK